MTQALRTLIQKKWKPKQSKIRETNVPNLSRLQNINKNIKQTPKNTTGHNLRRVKLLHSKKKYT